MGTLLTGINSAPAPSKFCNYINRLYSVKNPKAFLATRQLFCQITHYYIVTKHLNYRKTVRFYKKHCEFHYYFLNYNDKTTQ
jgi:hypothetical protein